MRTTLVRGYAGDEDLSAAIRIVDDFSGDLQSPARGQEWPGFSLFEALVSQPLQVNETWFGTRFAGAQVLSALTGKEIARRKTFWLLPLFSLWHRNEVHSLSFLE